MKKLILGLLVSALTLPAFADSNFTAEILLGMGDQKYSIGNVNSSSGDDVTFGLRWGYHLNEYFGLELAYQNHGQIDGSYRDIYNDKINDEVRSSAFNIGTKGKYPFPNGLSVHGRVGISFWNFELEETDSAFPGEKLTEDDNGNNLYYGLGLQYDITSQLVAGIEYSYLEMDVSILGVAIEHEVNNLALSIGYKF